MPLLDFLAGPYMGTQIPDPIRKNLLAQALMMGGLQGLAGVPTQGFQAVPGGLLSGMQAYQGGLGQFADLQRQREQDEMQRLYRQALTQDISERGREREMRQAAFASEQEASQAESGRVAELARRLAPIVEQAFGPQKAALLPFMTAADLKDLSDELLEREAPKKPMITYPGATGRDPETGEVLFREPKASGTADKSQSQILALAKMIQQAGGVDPVSKSASIPVDAAIRAAGRMVAGLSGEEVPPAEGGVAERAAKPTEATPGNLIQAVVNSVMAGEITNVEQARSMLQQMGLPAEQIDSILRGAQQALMRQNVP